MFQSPITVPTQLLPGSDDTQGEETPDVEDAQVQALVVDVNVEQYVPEPLRPAWDFITDHPLLLVLLLGALGWGIGSPAVFCSKCARQGRQANQDRSG